MQLPCIQATTVVLVLTYHGHRGEEALEGGAAGALLGMWHHPVAQQAAVCLILRIASFSLQMLP